MPRHTLPSRTLAASLSILRAEFDTFTTSFSAFTTQRATFAPIFMHGYARYRRETGRSFIAFVHELDPTVPAERDAYMHHRSVQAALYLRRLAEAPETQAKYRATVAPFEVLAMVVKGAMPFAEPNGAAYWAELRRACGWRDRDMDRLKDRVERSRAVPLHVPPRLVKRQHTLRMARAEAAEHVGA